MQATLVQPSRHNAAIRIGYLVAVFALLIALTPRLTLSCNVAAETRLHPALVNFATEQPDLPIRVIVQRNVANADLKPIIAQLGGQIMRDLHIINALVVELPAAKANGVAWISPDAPVWSSSSQPHTFVTWANATTLSSAGNSVDSLLGPNGTFATIGRQNVTFSDFNAEHTPSHVIIRVEVLFHAFVPAQLGAGNDPKLSIGVGNSTTKAITLSHKQFNRFTSANNADPLVIDITKERVWNWNDFETICG
ncbi:hypothetical protein [Chloroflexus sp.]|uniref:hypothetical protein n=1 Tax=Chloroflexus sp. TaxID=1904827 RepID=UPI002ACE34F7|nr:hypothetical protein [Chloroflexus sp.]